jgi:hypothetical protein
VQELQAISAHSTAITIESICAELDQANQVAKAKGQAAVMVSASAVEVGPAGTFDECESYAELAGKMLAECEAGFHPVTDDDREGLTELIERQAGELGEFLASIQARPVNGYRENPADVRWREFRASRPKRGPRSITGRQ